MALNHFRILPLAGRWQRWGMAWLIRMRRLLKQPTLVRQMCCHRAWAALLFWLGASGGATAQEPLALVANVDRSGRVVCNSAGPIGTVQSLEQSPDLLTWREFARTHGRFVDLPLSILAPIDRAFFRASARPKTAEDDWKNQLLLPDDPFLSGAGVEGAAGTRWVKFTLRLDQPGRVYFQDGARYLFHYPFAVKRLAGFENLTPDAFDEISLRTIGQQLVLGAVVLPADPAVPEVGVQLVGREPFPVQQVAAWLDQVRSAIALPAGWTVFYLPTFEQGILSPEDAQFLAGRGFPVSTPARWVQGDEVYSVGWAYGRLRFVPGGEIAAAYGTGKLRHSDILLTDSVPAEIPLVAGTIALDPATPNSHVAILSQSFGVPFVAVAGAGRQQQLRDWEGQELILLAEKTAAGSTVKTLNVQGLLTDSQREKLVQAKQVPALQITPFALKGTISLPVRDLTPQDIRFVGGKAANFGVLMRAIPDSAPADVLAFTFDLWSAFLDQVRPDDRTLRAVIRDRLGAHTFPPDAAKVTQDLAEIRALIRDGCDFTPAQKAAILGSLSPFGTEVKLRFRSSTNVEDSEQFSGAGLYDSYSGCPADDLDGDTTGPSRCDPDETGERGVFRALRRVYASFYNDNAFIERLRHRVDENAVGMAVLVHPSFPDEIELANGVATLRVTRAEQPTLATYAGEFVTQLGAASVSNPAGNARPEVVSVTQAAGGQPEFKVERRSGLVPLGGTVLRWPDEYPQLFHLTEAASREYARARPERDSFVLDLEYKKIAPGRLVVKQIREVPAASAATNPPPFVLNDAGRFVVFQHHGKDLYANHRLKSVWQFQALTFAGEPKTNGFDHFVEVAYHDGAVLRTHSGRISSFPNASIVVSGKTLEYRWTWPDGSLRGNYRLTATFEQTLNPSQPAPLSAATLVELAANYAVPQVAFNFDGAPLVVTSEKTRLVPLEKIIEGQLARSLSARHGAITITGDYTLAFLKFGVAGIGIFDGKSFPLVAWKPTTVTGLTSRPLRLVGNFSRSYDSIRHNFSETFLFEPGLEAGLDPDLLAELRVANIKAIRVLTSEFAFPGSASQTQVRFWGFDGRLRSPN